MSNVTPSSPSYADILQPYMPVFYIAFLVTLILTPLMRALARRHGVVDDPDNRRKVHAQPIAYLGGVSIFLGWLSAVTLAVFLHPHHSAGSFATIQIPVGVVLGAITVVLFGFMDDVYSLPPKYKITGQLLAAMLLILPGVTGFVPGDDFFLGAHKGPAWMILDPLSRLGYLPVSLDHSRLVILGATSFSALVAIFVVVGACNATNLLDGLDGLCSGVTGIMSIGYLVLALYLAHSLVPHPGGQAADPARITLSLALLGAVLGFLPYNYNPASIFMGDTGSMFLGYICGTMILLFGQFGTIRWFLAAIIMFGLPLMDTLLAIVRRKWNHRSIFSPDSHHFHHFLVRRGFSVRKAVAWGYGVAALFVSFAMVIVIMPTTLALGIYLVLFGWIVVAAFKMGMISQQPVVGENIELNLTVVGRRIVSENVSETPTEWKAQEPAAVGSQKR